MARTKTDLYGTDGLRMKVNVPAGYSTKWLTIVRATDHGSDEITMWFKDLQDIVNFGVIISQAAMNAIQEEADGDVEVETT